MGDTAGLFSGATGTVVISPFNYIDGLGGPGSGLLTFSGGGHTYSIQINSVDTVISVPSSMGLGNGVLLSGTSTPFGTAFSLPTATEMDSFDFTVQETEHGTTFSAGFFYYELAPNNVPDGGSAIALLGMTIAGLGVLRRKFASA